MHKVSELAKSFAFDGNFGGLLDSSEHMESYVILWTNPECQKRFESPLGGTITMRIGQNLMRFSKKEQCLTLAKELRTSFKIPNYRILRIFPIGEVEFLHPRDGVASEKVNKGRFIAGKL